MSKNYKGGYKLIDLEKVDMLEIEVGVIIKGIHKAIESSYAKPLLLTGIVIDGVEKNDVYIEELKVVDGSFVFKAYGYEITINDEDNVEAVEIHVPVKKSITSSETTYDLLTVEDGDEYLLSSTNEAGTQFTFGNQFNLVVCEGISGENKPLISWLNDGTTQLQIAQYAEIMIKRIGNTLLVGAIYDL